MRQLLQNVLLKKRKKENFSKLSWLWNSPISPHNSPQRWCLCTTPIFVQNFTNSYHCEFCGGEEKLKNNNSNNNYNYFYNYNKLRPSKSFTWYNAISITPGLRYRDAMKRIRSEFELQLMAANTNYFALATRINKALESSHRHQESYINWCKIEREQANIEKSKEEKVNNSNKISFDIISLQTLQDSVSAIRFAAASYALPYELGYLNNIIATLQLYLPKHQRWVQASCQEQTLALLRILGNNSIQCDNLLEVAWARYSCNIKEPCVAILLDHRMKRIVICFRGTLSLADAIADIASGYVKVCLNNRQSEKGNYDNNNNIIKNKEEEEEEALYVHIPKGFYDNVMNAGEQIMPALQIIQKEFSDYTILCVGHSLGAIEAILFHLLFFFPTNSNNNNNNNNNKVRTIAIAPAPCVDQAVVGKINKLLGDEKDEIMTSWMCGLDVVPRLQTSAIRHLFYPSDNTIPILSNKDLNNNKNKEEDKLHLLAIPGRLIHVGLDGSDVINVPIDASMRYEMYLGKEALLHHFPSVYSSALNKALKRKEMEEEKKKKKKRKVKKKKK